MKAANEYICAAYDEAYMNFFRPPPRHIDRRFCEFIVPDFVCAESRRLGARPARRRGLAPGIGALTTREHGLVSQKRRAGAATLDFKYVDHFLLQSQFTNWS